MKKWLVVCAFLLVLLSACENSGPFADHSRPWKDETGWHTTPMCGNHPTIHYIDIMMDGDERDASSTDDYYYYTHVKHYHGYTRSSHQYVTIPVSVPEYTCLYV